MKHILIKTKTRQDFLAGTTDNAVNLEHITEETNNDKNLVQAKL